MLWNFAQFNIISYRILKSFALKTRALLQLSNNVTVLKEVSDFLRAGAVPVFSFALYIIYKSW